MKVGDRVKIRYYTTRPVYWNSSGEMDMWMGEIVTIQDIQDIEDIHIKEDNGRWWWCEWDFESVVEMDKFDGSEFKI